MLENKRHFREFLQSEEKIASNILTDRLNMLEHAGMITKRQDPDHKQKIIYSLTEKSIDLLPILVESIRWSIKHEPVDKVKHKPAIDLLTAGSEELDHLHDELIKNHLSALPV